MRRAAGVVLLALACAPGVAVAATGDAVQYTVTLTKIEISKDSGSTYTTLFSGSQNIDIASASAGAVAANLVSGASCAAGTYDTVRVSIGANLQLKGYVNNGGTTLYTDGTTFSVNALAANTPGIDYAASTFSTGSPVTTTSGLAIVVQAGATPIVSVTFNASGVITQSGGVPSVSTPTVTISTR